MSVKKRGISRKKFSMRGGKTLRRIAKDEEALTSNIERHSDWMDAGKNDISLRKLLFYIFMFFAPVITFVFVSLKIGDVFKEFFEASPTITSKILMIPFLALVFLNLIPYLRANEKIAGIRYSVVAFLLIGFGMALPSALDGRFGLMLMLPTYFAMYLLFTFFYCPEVLGIERNLRDWFYHKKQMVIAGLYCSIVLLFVIGFGSVYYEIYTDPYNPAAFDFSVDKEPTLSSFIYYSMVSFTTTGYGEMIPVSGAARLLFFLEAIIGLVMNVVFIAILLVFISNAEFLSQKSEEQKMVHEVEQKEKRIEDEEKKIKNVEGEVVGEETNLVNFFRKVFQKK